MFSDNDQTLLIGKPGSGDEYDVISVVVDEKAKASHPILHGRRTASLALDVGNSTLGLYDEDLMGLMESANGGKGGWRAFARGPNTVVDLL